MHVWDPSQYLRFGDERLRPALDLLSRVQLAAPAVVYDLGCGSGTSTVILKERWPGAEVIGIDSSTSMLDRARALDVEISWREGDLTIWEPDAPCDLLFSNAVFQWLDNHEMIFQRLLSSLRPGGVLAVQMPGNYSASTHTAITETAREGPWSDRLEPRLRESPTHDLSIYYDILRSHTTSIDLWETTYAHVLEGDDPVVEWFKGSALRPLLDLLEEAEELAFLKAYGARVGQAYPRRSDGKTVMLFKRLFFVAVK
jgi:trans-aconitate 2-methyltransferase